MESADVRRPGLRRGITCHRPRDRERAMESAVMHAMHAEGGGEPTHEQRDREYASLSLVHGSPLSTEAGCRASDAPTIRTASHDVKSLPLGLVWLPAVVSIRGRVRIETRAGQRCREQCEIATRAFTYFSRFIEFHRAENTKETRGDSPSPPWQCSVTSVVKSPQAKTTAPLPFPGVTSYAGTAS